MVTHTPQIRLLKHLASAPIAGEQNYTLLNWGLNLFSENNNWLKITFFKLWRQISTAVLCHLPTCNWV